MSEKKEPWRKNLDKRYISGEDLKLGVEMGKGLRPEMVVTLVKYEDSPAFDKSKQKEVDKTAIWLKDQETGKVIYKPMLLNVRNGEFLEKEIGGGSMFINDFDTTIPFVIYAKPDTRFGHVVMCKKHYAKSTVSPVNALAKLAEATTLDELGKVWKGLSKPEQSLPTVIAEKDKLKTKLG